MVAPNSNFDGDMLSLTMQRLEDDFFDQISKRKAFQAFCMEHKCRRGIDGGPTIAIPILYAENGSYKRYSGAQRLNTSSNDIAAVFQYQWKQVALNIQAHGREILQNSGRSQRRDLLKSRIKAAEVTYANNIEEDCLSAGTSDGGLQIGGLQLGIADDGTGTVGGVSRSSFTFAQNQFYRATTDGGAALSATTLLDYMDILDLRLLAWDANVKTILADDNTFRFYEQTVHPLTRINQEKGAMGKLGFRTYQYKNAEVVYSPQNSGMPSNTMYWLDPEVIEFVYHNDRNMTRLPKRDSYDQDAMIEYLATMGNIAYRNFRRLGVLNND